jgi:hypothetical protein
MFPGSGLNGGQGVVNYRSVYKCDLIAHADGSTGENFSKHPFFWHDTVAGSVKDGAFLMALFADLGDLHQGGIPQPDLLSDFLGFPDNAGGGDILGKIPEIQDKVRGAHGIDTFGCQKTDLPVPVAGMGISLDAMVFQKFCLAHTFFGGALFFADGNGDYFHARASFFR